MTVPQCRPNASAVASRFYLRLTVQDRIYHGDVTEVAEGCPVLIGQLALEGIDLVVDTKNQRLIGNPAHGGQHVIENY